MITAMTSKRSGGNRRRPCPGRWSGRRAVRSAGRASRSPSGTGVSEDASDRSRCRAFHSAVCSANRIAGRHALLAGPWRSLPGRRAAPVPRADRWRSGRQRWTGSAPPGAGQPRVASARGTRRTPSPPGSARQSVRPGPGAQRVDGRVPSGPGRRARVEASGRLTIAAAADGPLRRQVGAAREAVLGSPVATERGALTSQHDAGRQVASKRPRCRPNASQVGWMGSAPDMG